MTTPEWALEQSRFDMVTERGENMIKRMMPGKDGNKYIPYDERSGEKSVVFFTRDLSEEGLKKIYDKV